MIAELRGILLEKEPPQLIVDVQGVGYEIDAPASTFSQLSNIGQEIKLYTHLIIREDAHQLYGFYTKNERQLFKTLLKANGIGPKSALNILSCAAIHEFVYWVLHNDTTNLVKLPGIGKKTAERLIIDLRDKLTEWALPAPLTMNHNYPESDSHHAALQDAIAALTSLGYKAADAHKIITKIDDGSASREELIRRALKEMIP